MSLTNLQNSPKSNESTPIGMDYKPFGGGLFNDMENEIWKDLVCYEGIYEVSNYGNVKSLTRNDFQGKPLNEKLLNLETINNYKRVALCKTGKVKRVFVHRLVAIHFIPNPDNKPCVNHRNGNPSDNRVENLEWVTYSENTQHAINTGLLKPATTHLYMKGVNHASAVKVVQSDLLGNDIKTWDCMADVQRELGIGHAKISIVCNGKRKTAGGIKWKYA